MTDRDLRRDRASESDELSYIFRMTRAGAELSCQQYERLASVDPERAAQYLAEVHRASDIKLELAAYCWHRPARACLARPPKPKLGTSLEAWSTGLSRYGLPPILVLTWSALYACMKALEASDRAKIAPVVSAFRVTRPIQKKRLSELEALTKDLMTELDLSGQSPCSDLGEALTTPWRLTCNAALDAAGAHKYRAIETAASFATGCVATACTLAGETSVLEFACSAIWRFALFETEWLSRETRELGSSEANPEPKGSRSRPGENGGH